MERRIGDVTIEKVSIETRPGFYLNGNLFRPKTPAASRIPAILCPHGHWTYGRFENTSTGSIPTRGIGLAKLGMVVLTYDMVGYGDTTAISHRFAIGHREGFDKDTLWGVNLLGLQLWNSIRALDFLQSLPDVDPQRIGATGASGGATQSFLLAAVDERVKAVAPVNMISAHMQGGSLCENAPNLRIDTNNMELGALAAPRPMLMVAATGDWTVNSPTVEYPAVRSIYQLLGEESKLHFVQFDAPHNYNQASREAAYGFFAHYFLGKSDATPVRERGITVPSLSDQVVFYGRPRPSNEKTEDALTAQIIGDAKQKLNDAMARDERSLTAYRDTYGTAFRYSLMAEYPNASQILTTPLTGGPAIDIDGPISERLALSRSEKRDRVEISIWQPRRVSAGSGKNTPVTLIVTPSSSSGPALSVTRNLAAKIVSSGEIASHISCFGDLPRPPASIKFLTTYNRSPVANRVQDILTALSYLHRRFPGAPIKVAGIEEAGLWTLLARGLSPKIDRTAIDASAFENSSDAAFVEKLAVPGLRFAGDFMTAVALAEPSPLLIHHTQDAFKTDDLKAVYRWLGNESGLEISRNAVDANALAAWLLRH